MNQTYFKMDTLKIILNQGMKLGLKDIFYAILVVLFYVFYMIDSLEKYQKGTTTMGERQVEIEPDKKRLCPIVIICPQPGFKTSYFDELKIYSGLKKFLLKKPSHKHMKHIENDIVNAYDNMSYKLGIDWNIHVWNQG